MGAISKLIHNCEKRIKKSKERERKKLAKKKLECKRKNLNKLKRQEALVNYRKLHRDKLYTNDTLGVYSILITQNYRVVKKIRTPKWRSEAIRLFNDMVEENKRSVRFPSKYFSSIEASRSDSKFVKNKVNEILLVEVVDDDGHSSSFIKNEYGIAEENIIVDVPSHRIITKSLWLEEETFYVYGFHPSNERKSFDYILDEIVLKQTEAFGINQVMVYNNYLIVKHDDDLSIVVCKCREQACDLHNKLSKCCEGVKYVIFIGIVRKGLSSWVIDAMVEKTGWERSEIRKIERRSSLDRT